MYILERKFLFLDYINLHSLVTLLGTLSYYWFGRFFPLRNALILFQQFQQDTGNILQRFIGRYIGMTASHDGDCGGTVRPAQETTLR